MERANAAEGGFMADLWKEVIAAEGRLQSSSGDVALYPEIVLKYCEIDFNYQPY